MSLIQLVTFSLTYSSKYSLDPIAAPRCFCPCTVTLMDVYYYYYSAGQSPSAPATVDSLPDFVLEHPSAGDISVCLTRRRPLPHSLSTSHTGLSSPSCLITWYIDIYYLFPMRAQLFRSSLT